MSCVITCVSASHRVQFYRLSAGDQRVHGLDGEPAGGVGALQGGALRTAGLLDSTTVKQMASRHAVKLEVSLGRNTGDQLSSVCFYVTSLVAASVVLRMI